MLFTSLYLAGKFLFNQSPFAKEFVSFPLSFRLHFVIASIGYCSLLPCTGFPKLDPTIWDSKVFTMDGGNERTIPKQVKWAPPGGF